MAIPKQHNLWGQDGNYGRPVTLWIVLFGWIVFCVSFALISFASLEPATTPPDGLYWDKVLHLVAYGALTFGLIFAWPRKSLVLIFLVSFGLGVVLEFLQGTVAIGRTTSIWDAVANALGALTIIGLWIGVCPLLKHNPA